MRGDSRYARRAAAHLRAWFVDPATKMQVAAFAHFFIRQPLLWFDEVTPSTTR